jgi:hypothetical protein
MKAALVSSFLLCFVFFFVFAPLFPVGFSERPFPPRLSSFGKKGGVDR